jgi:hypothetical protein
VGEERLLRRWRRGSRLRRPWTSAEQIRTTRAGGCSNGPKLQCAVPWVRGSEQGRHAVVVALVPVLVV